MDYVSCRDAAEEVARTVGKRLREVLNSAEGFKVNFKGSRDLVTEFDLWAEEEIKTFLDKRFPNCLCIGEETSSILSETKTLEELAADGYAWCIDPIDGTTNFVHGIPHVGISISLLERGVPRVGVVYDPCKDELFRAATGAGAELNGTRIECSRNDNLQNAVVATGFPYDKARAWDRCGPVFKAFLARVRGVRRFGAATLDGCWVACGRYDGFYEFALSSWDVSAASVIVTEAGGRVSNGSAATTDEAFSVFSDAFVLASPGVFEEVNRLVEESG